MSNKYISYLVACLKALKIFSIFLTTIFILFSIYCFFVTNLTPYVYENYGKQKTVALPDSLQASKAKSDAIYGDNYNNGRIGVIGTLGDSSGFMNAFFSLLAFAAVVVTFGYQFRNDRKSKRLSEKSEFESVFFNMTSTLEDIVTHLEYHDTGVQSNLFRGGNMSGLYFETENSNNGAMTDIIYKGRDK